MDHFCRVPGTSQDWLNFRNQLSAGGDIAFPTTHSIFRFNSEPVVLLCRLILTLSFEVPFFRHPASIRQLLVILD